MFWRISLANPLSCCSSSGTAREVPSYVQGKANALCLELVWRWRQAKEVEFYFANINSTIRQGSNERVCCMYLNISSCEMSPTWATAETHWLVARMDVGVDAIFEGLMLLVDDTGVDTIYKRLSLLLCWATILILEVYLLSFSPLQLSISSSFSLHSKQFFPTFCRGYSPDIYILNVYYF